jgi:hypothetical protein
MEARVAALESTPKGGKGGASAAVESPSPQLFAHDQSSAGANQQHQRHGETMAALALAETLAWSRHPEQLPPLAPVRMSEPADCANLAPKKQTSSGAKVDAANRFPRRGGTSCATEERPVHLSIDPLCVLLAFLGSRGPVRRPSCSCPVTSPRLLFFVEQPGCSGTLHPPSKTRALERQLNNCFAFAGLKKTTQKPHHSVRFRDESA